MGAILEDNNRRRKARRPYIVLGAVSLKHNDVIIDGDVLSISMPGNKMFLRIGANSFAAGQLVQERATDYEVALIPIEYEDEEEAE